MTPVVSIYLDICRVLAALVVFLSHTAGTRLTGFLVPEASSFGGEAVAAFFVLSGFVIAYVVDTREDTLRLYITSRLARLYSVTLLAIVITVAFDALGRGLQPELYVGKPTYWLPITWTNFLASFLFVNELWNLHLQLGTNGPYWSLGFEVWYYILCALIIFLPRAWRVIAITLWLVLVGPRIALACPIWLSGYAIYYLSKMRFRTPRLGLTLLATTSLIYLPYHLLFGQPFALNIRFEPTSSMLRSYVYCWGLGGLICLNFLGASMISDLAEGIAARVARPVRWLAGATFTFYLMHMPVAVLLCALSPWPSGSAATRIIVLGGTIPVILLLAECGERRKAWWRQLFSLLLSASKIMQIKLAFRIHNVSKR